MLKTRLQLVFELSCPERTTLAEIGKRLGRRLLQRVGSIANPDTILGWYCKRVAAKFDGSRQRRLPGRPPFNSQIERLVVRLAGAREFPLGLRQIVGALANLGHSGAIRRPQHPAPPRHRTGAGEETNHNLEGVHSEPHGRMRCENLKRTTRKLFYARIGHMETKLSQSRRNFLITGLGATTFAAQPLLGTSEDLATLTLKEAQELLRRKSASPVDLTQACLKRIGAFNHSLNAFITITGQDALVRARTMEAEAGRGKWRGPLHGIPIALKDNIDTAGVRTTAASALFKDRIPTEDAVVVKKLKNAGAIFLGKLNLHEFAYGGTSAVTYFGPVHNPWALDKVPGGSSGGSAAAVAADLCFGALGTDTGGSIRIPSSYCGIVGLMPTYGRVSNRGVIPMAWTLDHVGPMCKTVEDAALMLGVIAGYDEMDPTTVDVPVPDYGTAFNIQAAKLRLGLPRSFFFDNLHPEISRAVTAAIDVLRKLTANIRDVQLPSAVDAPIIWGPETFAYHAKWLKESPEKYQAPTRTMMRRWADIKPEVYAEARREVDLARREIKRVFSDVDLLVTPTMKTPPETIAASLNENGPPPAAAGTGRPGAAINNTAPFDVYGLPAITVPCGFTSSGLPIGLQISGAPFAESTVLALAHAYEQATDWHTRHPTLKTA
jgi:aspartyl-tRNA(Asn)/glutamyl-tRNA(Gln) amidotransferase subunit A